MRVRPLPLAQELRAGQITRAPSGPLPGKPGLPPASAAVICSRPSRIAFGEEDSPPHLNLCMGDLSLRIQDDLRAALKRGETETVSVLRLLRAALKNAEIEKGKRGTGLSDEETVEITQKETKKRGDAADLYRKGGRPELAEKEESEAAVLKAYLPEQLSLESLHTIVAEILKSGETNMGKVMGMVMAKVKGKGDGTAVRKIVEEMMR